jgi:MSHA biogenesis protein MshJ
MKQRIVAWLQSVDRLNLRERLALLAAGLFVIGGLWEATLAAPLKAREALAHEKVAGLRERLAQLDAALTTAAAGVGERVPGQLEQLKALRERVADGDEELRVFTTDLVDPAEMRLVLEELLRRQAALVLVSAVNRPARPVLAESDGEDAAAEEADTDAPRLYRHSLVLRLEGSYLDCLAYLKAVEQLPWQIHWSRLEFESAEYPSNDIVIEFTTLSLEKEWIGV